MKQVINPGDGARTVGKEYSGLNMWEEGNTAPVD
jgi:hypothetical protein